MDDYVPIRGRLNFWQESSQRFFEDNANLIRRLLYFKIICPLSPAKSSTSNFFKQECPCALQRSYYTCAFL